MKKKAIALAGCITATASTTSIANVLPENLVGLNLGEISSSSFLNQPFKGVIPFLFTSYENSKNFTVKLAPEAIFNEIGAEKHPILSNLSFQVTQQNNKPVILISSNRPIQLPFLNFVLEIEGPEGSVYQDYTVLLDPESKQATTPSVDYVVFDQNDQSSAIEPQLTADEELVIQGNLLLANLSSGALSSNNKNLNYRVKTGDSLSKIAQNQNIHNVSNKHLSRLIYQKNPTAFIRGDINKIKKGALLNLPSASEVNGFEIAQKNKPINTQTDSTSSKTNAQLSSALLAKATGSEAYTVVKGDSLSSITKKYATKDISFTKLLNAIHISNPDAFVNKSKNIIKAGAELSIPTFTKTNADQEFARKESLSTDKVATKSAMATMADKKSVELETNANINEALQNKVSATENVGSDQYQIAKGDTLSSITKEIGYKEVPFAKMLKAIYTHNPEVFVDGKMTQLTVGGVITLPPLTDIQSSNAVVANTEQNAVKPLDTNNNQVAQAKNVKVAAPNATINQSAPPTDLIKRIRELRKELQHSQDNLSDMKVRLNQKEILLQQKNTQFESLKVTLANLNVNSDPQLIATSAVAVQKVLAENISTKDPIIAETYQPKSKAEIAKLKRELLERQDNTNNQLQKIKNITDKTLSVIELPAGKPEVGVFKKYAESDIVSFAKNNYSYITIALLLGLMLVRYRRQLYAYTYSTIDYDQPTYYPMPDTNKFELKETNINFHDPKMDEDAKNYETLPSLTNETIESIEFTEQEPEEAIEPIQLKEQDSDEVIESIQPIDQESDEVIESVELTEQEPEEVIESLELDELDELTKSIESIESDIVINPLLVEATQDIFISSEEANQIEDCEHLVKELFENTGEEQKAEEDSKWQDIEEVCDTYIDKIKITGNLSGDEDRALVEEATDFNHMMSDLLDSLDKVDKSLKRNNIDDEDFPDLIAYTNTEEYTEDQNRAL